MTTPPSHSFLFAGVLLLALLPALRAADRLPGFQPQTASAAPKKPGFFSRLFGGKTRPPDNENRRRSVALAQPALYSNPLPPSTDMDTPVTIRRNADNTYILVQPLPLTPSRVVAPPVPSVRITSPAPVYAPSITVLPGAQAPSLALLPPAAALPAAAPLFAQPVPGKPGCVYPPGLQRIPANIVDVTGMHPGSKARDPVTNVIFMVP